MEVIQIKHHETEEWLLRIHYAKRMPSITYAFGLYEDGILEGIITYGMPPSRTLCTGICGEKYKDSVIELNRLCLLNNKKNQASQLISKSIRLLPKPSIIVSFADTEMKHHGYIYQATNFIYTGLSDKHSEWRIKDSNYHGKSVSIDFTLEQRENNPEKFEKVIRSRKHRYIYFAGNKKQKKLLTSNLNYNIKPYPKGNNTNYKTGHKPTVQTVLF